MLWGKALRRKWMILLPKWLPKWLLQKVSKLPLNSHKKGAHDAPFL
jgi:hypothetical protein